MSPADLIASLRAAGDPLHLLAADALTAWSAELETLRARAILLEAVARLNGETIRAMPAARLRSRPASLGSFGAYPPLTIYWHPLNLNDAIRVLQLNEPVAL
jgi:hypothetical protein